MRAHTEFGFLSRKPIFHMGPHLPTASQERVSQRQSMPEFAPHKILWIRQPILADSVQCAVAKRRPVFSELSCGIVFSIRVSARNRMMFPQRISMSTKTRGSENASTSFVLITVETP